MALRFVVLISALFAGQLGDRLRISGQVQDAQLDVVAGAEVAVAELYGDGFYSPKSDKLLGAVKITDEEGRFSFDVWAEPRHDVVVLARKSGLALGWKYIYREHTFLAQPDTIITADILLRPPKGIAGQLVDPQGKAVANADIQVVPYIRNGGKDVYAPQAWLAKKTDAQGNFAFDNLPSEAKVKFFVEVLGRDIIYIFPSQELQGNAGGGYRVDWEDVELKLPPATTLQGRVVNRATNQGIRGLRLMLYPEHMSKCPWRFCGHEVFSGTNGAFEMTGLPPGLHLVRLVAEDTDWVTRIHPIKLNGLDKTAQVEINVERGVPIDVKVRDRTTGRVVPDITVYIDDRQHLEQIDVFQDQAKTDVRGMARLHAPQGQFKLHAWGDNHHDGFKEKGIPLSVTGPREQAVEIPVVPLLPLVRGKAVDTQGQPAENVRVMVGLGQTVLTDKQGRFEAIQNALYPSHLVMVQDAERDLAGAKFFYDAVRELRVVLRPSSSIRGRVTDDRGRGIAGAKVSLGFNRKRRGGTRDVHGVVHLRDVRTDAQGYYEFKTLVPVTGASDHYRLTYQSADFGSSSHVLEDAMKPGQDVILPDVQLVSLNDYLSGVVLDENNNPVPRKPVFVGSDAGGSHDSRATSTDEHGRFRVDRIPLGPVTIQVDFGQGDDAAYVYAHSGDHVTIRLGQHFTNFVPQDALVGRPLPDLSKLEIGLDNRRMQNKKVLLCFVDYTQRASQIAISQLQRFSSRFRANNVEIICIQAAPVDEDDLGRWKRQNKISFPIYVLPGRGAQGRIPLLQQNPDITQALRRDWGVRSLPWTILTDERQQIVATGINAGRVLTLVHETGRMISPLESPRRNK